jgi:hypothetical protein
MNNYRSLIKEVPDCGGDDVEGAGLMGFGRRQTSLEGCKLFDEIW